MCEWVCVFSSGRQRVGYLRPFLVSVYRFSKHCILVRLSVSVRDLMEVSVAIAEVTPCILKPSITVPSLLRKTQLGPTSPRAPGRRLGNKRRSF